MSAFSQLPNKYQATIHLNYTSKSHVITGDFPKEFIAKFLNLEGWLFYNRNLRTGAGWVFPSVDGGLFYLHALRLGLADCNIKCELIVFDQLTKKLPKKMILVSNTPLKNNETLFASVD